jgi:hypothetical protein
MHNYCQSKETQYLKDLANAIIRKPAAINCIALFIRPSVFLSPLCSLLDEWRWDEIHGESHSPPTTLPANLNQARHNRYTMISARYSSLYWLPRHGWVCPTRS